MKKILVVSFGSDAGGIEKSLIEFLKYLVSCELDVDLYLWKKPGVLYSQIPSQVNVLDYKLYPGSLKEINVFKEPINVIWYLIFRIFMKLNRPVDVFKKLNKHYDIAISFCQNGYSPYYVIDKVDADRKYLWYHHGSYDKQAKDKIKDEKYYSKFDKVVTVSETNKEMLLSYFPNLKIEVIHNLIDEDKIKLLANDNIKEFENYHGLKLVTVGRIAEEKGQAEAIEIAKKLKNKNVDFKWVFVGDGPLLDKCNELVNEYDLDEQCLFVGVKTNPYPYMKSADIYVQPSLIEADPITIREALCLNKFIIATDLPSFKEILKNGKLGCISPLESDDFVDNVIYFSDKRNQNEIIDNVSKNESINGSIKKDIINLL